MAFSESSNATNILLSISYTLLLLFLSFRSTRRFLDFTGEFLTAKTS